MDSGGHAVDRQLRQRLRETREQPVTAPPVHDAGAPHVAVVLAAPQELGERELVEHRREVVEQPLRPLGVVGGVRRDDDPAEPERRRERLRDRAELDHVLGRDALEGAAPARRS